VRPARARTAFGPGGTEAQSDPRAPTLRHCTGLHAAATSHTLTKLRVSTRRCAAVSACAALRERPEPQLDCRGMADYSAMRLVCVARLAHSSWTHALPGLVRSATSDAPAHRTRRRTVRNESHRRQQTSIIFVAGESDVGRFRYIGRTHRHRPPIKRSPLSEQTLPPSGARAGATYLLGSDLA